MEESTKMNSNDSILSKITFNSEILSGKPIIRSSRISVAIIWELLAKGTSNQEILEDYPDLEMADIDAVLLYPYRLIKN